MTIGLRSSIVIACALLGACGQPKSDEAQTAATDAATSDAVPSDVSSQVPATADTGADTATPAKTSAATPEPSSSATAEAMATKTAAAVKPTSTPAAVPSAAVAAVAPPQAFGICAACHSVEPGKKGVGPSLAGVFGRKAGSSAGYAYSDALKSSGIVWNAQTLDTWLQGPMKMVPGTKMAIAVSNPAGRKAVIEYLRTLK